MEDDPGAAEDERAIELSSIAAIFPEIVLDPHSAYKASLAIPVSPAVPLMIEFQQPAESSAPTLPTPPTSTEPEADDLDGEFKEKRRGEQEGPADVHSLTHLPPLDLKILLPEGYPAEKPPKFELSSSAAWVSEDVLQKLTLDGTRLWEEQGRDPVVYTYIDHLQQAAETGFDFAKDGKRPAPFPSDLKIALLDYDLKAQRAAFERSTFECGICLEPKKGTMCYRLLLCSHVFCIECLQDCYNRSILEGDVDNVKCLDPGCGKHLKGSGAGDRADPERAVARRRRKHDPTLSPSELLQIPLSQETVQRYVHFKRKKKLESDKNTVYCPRQWCQGAARSKKHPKPIDPMHDVEDVTSDSEADIQTAPPTSKKNPQEIPMSERLCICEDCSYAFCSVCRKGWHGELTSASLCNPRSQIELNDEEKATAEYLTLHSTPCPTCSAPCSKTMGCNHMICFKCQTHFCYLCSSYLMESNPYQHFNDKTHPCYLRLWELEGGDDERAELVRWEVPPEEFDPDSDTDSEDERELNWGDVLEDDGRHFSDDEDEVGREPLQGGPADGAPQLADMRIEIVNFGREGAGHRVIRQMVPAPAPPPQQVAPPPAPGPRRRGRGARPPALLFRGGGAPRGRGAPVPRQNPNQPQGRGRGRGRGRAAPAGQQLPQRPAGVAPRPPPPAPAPPAAPDGRPERDASDSDTEDEVPLRFMPRNLPAAPPPAPPAAAPGQGNAGGPQQPAVLRQMGLERFLQLAERDQEDEWDSDELEDELEEGAVRALEERRRRAVNRRIW